MENSSASIQADLRSLIKEQIDQPRSLEQLYQKDRQAFKKAFAEMYPEIREHPLAAAWHERLHYRSAAASTTDRYDWIFIGLSIFTAGMILKLPELFRLDEETFYTRNVSFAVFPMLTAFFAWKNGLSQKRIILLVLMFGLSALYINLLPHKNSSDTIDLACLHLPILFWSVLGYSFLGNAFNSSTQRIDYLKFNGDLIVISALMAIAGVLFTLITFGLFSMIGMDIENFYGRYIALFAAPAIPILGTYLVRNNPTLVNRISPLIARIFTPLVFVMLLVFLISMLITGKDPYQDREFLLIFNGLLIGVMAIILFSITEAAKGNTGRIQQWLLFGLSILTLIVNGIALSAITFRLIEFGLTPNRLAVLGSNLLIMTHLLLVTYRIWENMRGRSGVEKVEQAIAWFLPAYTAWTVIVVFIFPVLFRFQ